MSARGCVAYEAGKERNGGEAAMSDGRQFPLLRGHRERNAQHLRQSIPWEMIAPHEAQAQRNHGQSLQRLAERGGLAPEEAVDVLLGLRWNTTRETGADAKLEALINEWEHKP